MVDQKKSDSNQQKPGNDLPKIDSSPQSGNPSNPTSKQNKPKQNRNYANYVMWALKAIRNIGAITAKNSFAMAKQLWKIFTTIVDWIDKRGAFITALATVLIAVLTIYYVKYSKKQWIVMSDQLKITEKQLEITDRPWIKDEVSSSSDFIVQNGAISWALDVKMNNIGHSVATDVFPQTKLIAVNNGDTIDGPRRQVRELCNELSKRSDEIMKDDHSTWNSSVFPGDTWRPFASGVTLWPKDIAKNSMDGGKTIIPMLIGCIDYRYSGLEKHHHTGFVYLLSHTEDLTIPEAARGFFSLGKTVPKDKIILTKFGQIAD